MHRDFQLFAHFATFEGHVGSSHCGSNPLENPTRRGALRPRTRERNHPREAERERRRRSGDAQGEITRYLIGTERVARLRTYFIVFSATRFSRPIFAKSIFAKNESAQTIHSRTRRDERALSEMLRARDTPRRDFPSFRGSSAPLTVFHFLSLFPFFPRRRNLAKMKP